MFKIGLTGGIGSGKSRVADMLDYGDARLRTIEKLSEPSLIGMKKLSLEMFQREVRQ